jgi:calcium-dependent protein kinase
MYSEKEAAKIMKQVMSAIEYCHNNGICHRDLKPENLLFLKKGDEANNPLKVIDFGLSKRTLNNMKFKTRVGTPYYISPEILAGSYNQKCDIWSAGVILYSLLSGELPFNGSNAEEIYSKIEKMEINFPPEKWDNISKEAKDLINHMLIPQKERYTAGQVLAHSWFKIINEIPLEKLNFDVEFFKRYIRRKQLKKMIIVYIASRLQENEISDLKEIFKAFDKDNDGQISYNEFKEGILKLKSNSIKESEFHSYFDSIDTDKNNKIDFTEFIASILHKKTFLKKERLFEAFCMLDKQKNGKISKQDIMDVLKLEPKDSKYIAELMKSADSNGDGFIDYKEFLLFMGYEKEDK